MNIQTPLVTPDDDQALYDRDFAEWLAAQEKSLNERDATQLDWNNLAGEIRDMGGNLLRELASRMDVLLMHIIKLRLSHADRPRAGWRKTIRVQRTEIGRLLKQSPSLRQHLPDLTNDLFDDARAIALDALEEHEPALSPEYRKAAMVLKPDPAEIVLDRDWFPPTPTSESE